MTEQDLDEKSEWTVTTLRHLLQKEITNLNDLTDAKFVTFRTLIDSESAKVALALDAANRAVNKAESASDKRFDAVNKFRDQLNDQTAALLPRTEMKQAVDNLERQIAELKEQIIALRTYNDKDAGGRAAQQSQQQRSSAMTMASIAVVGVLVSLLVIFVNVFVN